MTDFYLQLIGLEVCQAEELLKQKNDNFKFVFYRDKKQKTFDKEIVTAVKFVDDVLVVVVCPMQFSVNENESD